MSQFSAFNPQQLIEQFQKAQEENFNKLLATIKGIDTTQSNLFNAARTELGTIGGTAKERIRREGRRTLARERQNLISRGLANTTRGPNLARSIDKDVAFTEQGVDETLAGQRVNLLTQQAGAAAQTGGLLANALSNAAPDLSLFASLLQAAQANAPQQSVTRIGAGSVGGSAGQPRSGGSFGLSGGGGGGGGGGGSAGSSPSSGGSGSSGGGGGSGARIVGPGAKRFSGAAQQSGPSFGDRILRSGRGATPGSSRGAQGQVLNPSNAGVSGRARVNLFRGGRAFFDDSGTQRIGLLGNGSFGSIV